MAVEKVVGKRWCTELPIEVVFFIYAFSSCLNAVAVGNLLLQKLCFPDGPPGINAVCHDPESLSAAEDVNTMRMILRNCVTGVVVLLAGVWISKTGLTRPLFYLPITGEIVGAGIVLFGSYSWSSSPWLIGALEGAVISVTGGSHIFPMAVTSYITDHSTINERTSRLTIMMVAFMSAASMASFCGGYILNVLGYHNYIYMTIGLYLLSLCCSMYCIQDGERKVPDKNSTKRFVDLAALKVLLTSRPNNFVVWSMPVTCGLIIASISGELSSLQLFLEKAFDFSVTGAGVFNAVSMAVSAVCSIIIINVATRIFKIEDTILALFASVVTTVYVATYVFAKTSLQLFLFSLLGWGRAIVLATAKSLMSKNLHQDEIGIFFSISQIFEAVVPLAFLPLYDYVFKATIKSLPGAIFLISTGIFAFTSVLLCLCAIFQKHIKEDEEAANEKGVSSEKKDLNL